MSDNQIRAKVLWFNGAKGYGLVRAQDSYLDDIRVDATILEEGQSLLRDALVEIVYKEELIGLVAQKLVLIDNQTGK